MSYSLNLKTAMFEIVEVLKRHDIAAHIILHEPGYSEYLLHVDPSWSCARIEGDFLRVRSLGKDYGGDRGRQMAAAADTVNMLAHFADICARDAKLFREIEARLSEDWEIEHGPGTHTPALPEGDGVH